MPAHTPNARTCTYRQYQTRNSAFKYVLNFKHDGFSLFLLVLYIQDLQNTHISTIVVWSRFYLVYTFIIQCSLGHQGFVSKKSKLKSTSLRSLRTLRPRQPLFKCMLIDRRALAVHVFHYFALEDLSLPKQNENKPSNEDEVMTDKAPFRWILR